MTQFDDRERAFEAKFARDEEMQFRVIARRIPARRYDSDADLRKTLASAVPEFLEGRAVGPLSHVTSK